MTFHRGFASWPAAGLCLSLLLPGIAGAVEISDMKGFEALFGRYAPGGDCAREPRVVVDATGIAIDLKGADREGHPARVRGELRWA